MNHPNTHSQITSDTESDKTSSHHKQYTRSYDIDKAFPVDSHLDWPADSPFSSTTDKLRRIELQRRLCSPSEEDRFMWKCIRWLEINGRNRVYLLFAIPAATSLTIVFPMLVTVYTVEIISTSHSTPIAINSHQYHSIAKSSV